jgi:hypothetical protein
MAMQQQSEARRVSELYLKPVLEVVPGKYLNYSESRSSTSFTAKSAK